MRHAYLIMAHSDFYLLKRLIQAIDNPDGDIFLHLDASKEYPDEDIEELTQSVKYSKLSVFSEIPIVWGGETLVQCELFLMNKAISGHYGYYHLLSGQDFLLKPVRDIQKFFSNNSDKEFLAVDTNPLNKKSIINRIDQYHIILKNRHITMALDRIIQLLQTCLGIHRLSNEKMDAFGKGMQWASMSHLFVSYILQEQEIILDLAHHALCFDEIYKQMVYKTHQDKFELYYDIDTSDKRGQMPRYQLEVSATMHKVDWERGTPYTYRLDDYQELIDSPCMFARKFNSAVDRDIIDRLYQHVMKK